MTFPRALLSRVPLLHPPLGSVVDRRLLRRFAGVFLGALLVVVLLNLLGDVLNRIDNLMEQDAALSTAVRYFLYRLPLTVSRVMGFAALFAAFLTLGSLARRNELLALQTGGISLHRITLPFLLAALGVSAVIFFWNETVTPSSTRKARHIYDVEVHKREQRSVFGNDEIWMRSNDAFLRADDFDTRENRLRGLVLYRLTPDFALAGIIETPAASWDGAHWVPHGGAEWRLLEDGSLSRRPLGARLPLDRRPRDFRVFARSPDEFGYFELRERIGNLQDKGVDTVRDEVDLYTKLAIPLAMPFTILLAAAFAVKRKGGPALNFGLTLAIGFSYWVLLGFCVSLGKAGAMPPWLSAWLPNVIVGLLSLFLYTGSE